MKQFFLYRRWENPIEEPSDAGVAVRHPPRLADLRSLVGGRVVDPSSEEIGRLFCIWEDGDGDAAFLGLKTGWLGIGLIHVVPAGFAELDEATNTIRLPFSKQTVRDAPTCAVEDELDPRRQRDVFDYYYSQGGKTSQPAEENSEGASVAPKKTSEEERVPEQEAAEHKHETV